MFKKIRSFFTPPKLSDKDVFLTPYSGYQSDKAYEENAQKLALHDLDLQKEALQKNLILMHRSVMVSVAAVMVAVLALVTAVVIATHAPKPTVILNGAPTTQVHK